MEERATGRSTRLIDKYIQEFFTNPPGIGVRVMDHNMENDAEPHTILLERVVSRLRIEHPNVDYAIDRVTNSIMRMS